jgi:hypothetical protein
MNLRIDAVRKRSLVQYTTTIAVSVNLVTGTPGTPRYKSMPLQGIETYQQGVDLIQSTSSSPRPLRGRRDPRPGRRATSNQHQLCRHRRLLPPSLQHCQNRLPTMQPRHTLTRVAHANTHTNLPRPKSSVHGLRVASKPFSINSSTRRCLLSRN